MDAVVDVLRETIEQVEFTQEQKENLEKFKEQKISKLTEQFSFDDCKKAVDSLYKFNRIFHTKWQLWTALCETCNIIEYTVSGRKLPFQINRFLFLCIKNDKLSNTQIR